MSSSDLSGYNTNDGDGCSSLCAIESNYICSGGSVSSPDSCSACPAELSSDATKTSCVATCGDSKRTSSETCDDGDTTSGDGCSSSCAIEAGLICNGGTTSSPDVCNICSAGLTQSQTALFVSHIVETAREQVRRLVMTVTQTMEMDAVHYVQSSQTIFEVENQYHLQIRVHHALPDYTRTQDTLCVAFLAFLYVLTAVTINSNMMSKMSRFNEFFNGVKLNILSRWYSNISLTRSFLFYSILCIFAGYNETAKLVTIILIQACYFGYLCVARPFVMLTDNIVEIFLEGCLFCYIIALSKFVADSSWNDSDIITYIIFLFVAVRTEGGCFQ